MRNTVETLAPTDVLPGSDIPACSHPHSKLKKIAEIIQHAF